jgi:hypothetical protein
VSTVERPESLSDDLLLARVEELVRRSRRAEAELIWHLAEVDRRRLYRREACPSMHVYATARLHLSDAEAYLRITVARVSRRFPVVLRMLADGRLHLSAIAKLAPHLGQDNCDTLLAQAVRCSKREVEMLVARIAPRPDVPSGMRRLPGVRPSELGPGGVDDPAPVRAGAGTAHADGPAGEAQADPPPPSPTRPENVLAPLAESRYRVQFTAGEALHAKITRAQAMLRHQVPDGDLAAVFDRAMTLLLRDLERARYAATPAPRKSAAETDPTPSSRRIPDPIKREVWTRDEEQCTFRDREGRRCPARERLEFHHLTPFAQGGDHSESNLTLRCSSHNAYQADLDFGTEFMAERRTGAGRDRAAKPRGGGRCGEAVGYEVSSTSASGVRCEGAVWFARPRAVDVSSLATHGGLGSASPAADVVLGSASPAAHIVLGPPLMDNARAASGGGVARYPQRPPALV